MFGDTIGEAVEKSGSRQILDSRSSSGNTKVAGPIREPNFRVLNRKST